MPSCSWKSVVHLENFAEHSSLFCKMEMAAPRSHFSLKLKRTLHFRTISGLLPACIHPDLAELGMRMAVGGGVQRAGDLLGRPPPRERKMQKEPGKLSQTSDRRAGLTVSQV